MLHSDGLQQPPLNRAPQPPNWAAHQLDTLPVHDETRTPPGLPTYHEPHHPWHHIQGTLSHRYSGNLSVAGAEAWHRQDTHPLHNVRHSNIFSAGSGNRSGAEQQAALPAWQYSQNTNCMHFNCAMPQSSARPAVLSRYMTAEYLLSDDDQLQLEAPSSDAALPQTRELFL